MNADNNVSVKNDKYPNMFMSMAALAKAADNSIKNPVSKSLKYLFAAHYDYLEFRQIFQNYMPVYDDVVHFLPDDKFAIVEALHKIAKEYDLHETYSYFYIEYKYKNKVVMSIWTDNWWIEPHGEQKQWTRNIHVRLRGSSRPEYQKNVQSYGEEFVKYFFRHLNYCSCCNPDHVVGKKGIRQVLGKNARICSPELRGEIDNPTIEDLPYIRKYIDLRIKEILEQG